MSDHWLVLDVDDTLVDTYAVSALKCARTAEAHGLAPPDPVAYAALYGRYTFEECVRRWHPGVDVAEYSRSYDALADLVPAVPIGNVHIGLDRAAALGFRIGVLTNGPARKTARKLAAVGLDGDDVDFVVSAESGGPRKPDPSVFRALAGRFGVRPDRAWYVSDDPADWRGAVAAGFAAVGVVHGSRPLPATVPVLPDLLVPDIAALADCLASVAGTARQDPARPVTAVSFDAGFTLLDHRRTPDQLIAARGRGLPRAAPAPPTSLPPLPATIWRTEDGAAAALRAHYVALAARQVATSHVERVADGALADYQASVNWRARPAAADALRRLGRSGLGVGVLSNWPPPLREVLHASGLADGLDAILASTTLGAAKPDAAAFQGIAAALGAPVGHVLHVGDDPVHDAAGALAAGCRALLVREPFDAPATRTALGLVTR